MSAVRVVLIVAAVAVITLLLIAAARFAKQQYNSAEEPGRISGVGEVIDEAALTSYEKGRNRETAGPVARNGSMSLQAMGACDDGGLWFKGRGFTPVSDYVITAQYPDGRDYKFVANGVSADDGSTPNMGWDCYDTDNGRPDPAGNYQMTVTDKSTGKSVTILFAVFYEVEDQK